jgi:hypothetical protein
MYKETGKWFGGKSYQRFVEHEKAALNVKGKRKSAKREGAEMTQICNNVRKDWKVVRMSSESATSSHKVMVL